MGNRRRQKNSTLEQPPDFIDWLGTLLLAFCAAVIPLIIVLHQVKLDPQSAKAYSGATDYIDLFNYWKSILLQVALVLLLVFWMVRLIQRHTYKTSLLLVPLGAYAMLAIISTVFSKYAWISKNGFPDRLEGLFVILCYVLLGVTAASILSSQKTRMVVIIATFCSAVVLAALGLSQYLDADFLKTSLGRALMVPDSYAAYRDVLTFNFGKNIMYTTVYNPNYLGSYSALLLPVSIALVYQWCDSGIKKTVIGLLFVSAAFILWIGGMSRAGLLGGAVSILMLLVLLFRDVRRHWRITLVGLALCLGLLLGMNHFSDGAVVRELKTTMPSSLANLFPAGTEEADAQQASSAAADGKEEKEVLPPRPFVKTAKLVDNAFLFETETETIRIRFEKDGFLIENGKGEPIPYTMTQEPASDGSGNTENYIRFSDPAYRAYVLRMVNSGTVMQWYSINIPLIVVDGVLTVNTKENVYISKVDEPDTVGFKGRELFANSRGYIWSRSIPLLRDTLLIGHGPDTFAAYYPQNDLASNINFLYDYNRMVDKPHCWYLQLGINTGVLSLLCMLVLFAWYVLRGLRIRNEPSLSEGRLLHIGILCGVVGYAVAAVFNDSNVSVSPVFWTIFGVGLSYIVHTKREGNPVRKAA